MPDDLGEDGLIARVEELERQFNALPRLAVNDAKRLFTETPDAAYRIRELELKKAILELEIEKLKRMRDAPKWLQPAGLIFGFLTLVFFMALVVASIFGKVVPAEGKFPVLIVLALGTGLSASFLTGHATLSGQIPFFGDEHPLAVSAGGGFAIIILILLVGWKIYL